MFQLKQNLILASVRFAQPFLDKILFMAALRLHADKLWEFLFFDLIENHTKDLKRKTSKKISID